MASADDGEKPAFLGLFPSGGARRGVRMGTLGGRERETWRDAVFPSISCMARRARTSTSASCTSSPSPSAAACTIGQFGRTPTASCITCCWSSAAAACIRPRTAGTSSHRSRCISVPLSCVHGFDFKPRTDGWIVTASGALLRTNRARTSRARHRARRAERHATVDCDGDADERVCSSRWPASFAATSRAGASRRSHG